MAKRRRSPTHRGRWPLLDVARGVAIVAMIVYHFCFDLAWNGWLKTDFGEDWRWLGFRTLILGAFLFIAGASLAIAETRGQSERNYWRRIGIITGAALVVTGGSYAMFPDSFIYFGVLHAIALMSVLARPLLRFRDATFVLGAGIVVAGVAIQSTVFDHPMLHWIGMMTFKPRTEDYVPLFPWFGAFLIGAGLGLRLAKSADASASQSVRLSDRAPPRGLDGIRWLGRHSLAVYLIHQPLLLGSMLLVKRLY